MIRVKAPTRVDICGGTLDLWPIHQVIEHKATVNVGISLFAQVEISRADTFIFESEDLGVIQSGSYGEMTCHKKLPLFSLMLHTFWKEGFPALRIKTKCLSPAGAGLGGSSCLAVALASAFIEARNQYTDSKLKLDNFDVVSICQDIEAKLIHSPTGIQDYWGGMNGGVNIISYPTGKPVIENLNPDSSWSEMLILCHSGQSRSSAINNWEVFKSVFDHDSKMISSLNDIGKISEDIASAIREESYSDILDLSLREWQIRQKLWPTIETELTRKVDTAARKAGAKFSRVCGAGGGGVVAIFCDQNRLEVEASLKKDGYQILECEVVANGVSSGS